MHRPERGMALVTVMTTTVVLVLLAAATVAYGVGSQDISRHDQDWNAALAAAEAGIDDYLFRLNENGNYWQYDSTNPPPEPPLGDGNLAFTEWVAVPGGNTGAEFRYDVDTASLTVDGRISIESTGRVDDTERTVEATLRRRSFLDYLYFTDYETRDPAAYPGGYYYYTPSEAQTYCARHWYEPYGSRRDVNGRDDFSGDHDEWWYQGGWRWGPYCTEINFVSGDSVNGPLHTNDAFLVCGSPSFNGETSTSYDPGGGDAWRENPGCSGNDPDFANAGDPQILPPLTMPPSNSAIKAETETGLGGCLYTGPTEIVLHDDGTMTVDSPFSIDTMNGPCPTSGTGPLPANGVVYVQSVPADTADPNHTAGCPFWVSGRNHPLGYPIWQDVNDYDCRAGDAFVEGELDGQLTVAAENDIVITWHLEYEDGVAGDDLLGLVANNDVAVYHPVKCSNPFSYSCNLKAAPNHPTERFDDPRIDAAMLSVNHSFTVQKYNYAEELGDLHVTGAIAQRYRGPVGTFGYSGGSPYTTGYLKDYVYDQRLQYLSPPKFLDPVASAWGVATWAEVSVPDALG